MRRAAFDLFHPAVAFVYFAVMLALAMTAAQPVCALIAYGGAISYDAALRGPRAASRAAARHVPAVLVIAAANLLFSATGATELFRLGTRAFYAESLAYGACMGLVLASVLALFSNASRVLDSDKVMALFGRVAPTVGLMLSMVMRLVPQFARRGLLIADVERACTAARLSAPSEKGLGRSSGEGFEHACAGGGGRLAGFLVRGQRKARSRLRQVSVLMEWGMEDSLETADAMRARGWGASPKRTTYARHRFRSFDAAALACVCALALAAALSAWALCARFRFYPVIDGLAPWWAYLPYVLFAFLPLAITAKERLTWRS